jgi:hypothetical protein
MARKMNPDEWADQRAEWARERREFEATYERLKARWRDEDERRERRRRLIRRLLLLGR